MTPAEYADQLLAKGESRRIEFKASVEPMDKIARSVCAFLNTDGGFVLVGVADDGIPNRTATEEQSLGLQKYLHKEISPVVLIDVIVDETSNGPVITVIVPAGPDTPYVFQGAVYLRKGSRTVTADAESLRTLVAERGLPTTRWERRPSVGFEIEDVDRGLLAETVRRAQSRRGYRIEHSEDPAASLEQLSLLHSGQPTNAADVLFGRSVAHRHPQTRIRAVCYETDRAEDFLDEQLYEGPAFVLLESGMAFLKRHVSIGAVFREGSLPRESRPSYPFNALREGLVNALVHRDYSAFSGGVSVSVFTDRVEIWNSGRLPQGLSPRDLFHASHPSILVNPDIGHVFYLHELMERVGRGTYLIARECRELGTQPPQWRNIRSGVRLTLFAAPIDQAAEMNLNDRQKDLLKSLKIGDRIRLGDYLQRIGHSVSDRQARRDLSELEGFGLLVRHGAGSRTIYERAEDQP